MRPLIALSIEQMLAVAKEQWDDPSQLTKLLDETGHRKTKRAGMLRRDLQKRIAFLNANPPKGPHREQEPTHSEMMRRLRAAEARTMELERELVTVRSAKVSPVTKLLSKWGLSESCPSYLFQSAKRFWRKQLHPDTHAQKSAAERKLLERRFQEFEADIGQLTEYGWSPS